jgi:maltose O-acetyltransferase
MLIPVAATRLVTLVPLKSLNQLWPLRELLVKLRTAWLKLVVGINANWGVRSSLSSRFAPGARGSITIGAETLIAFKTLVFTIDPITGQDKPVLIGARCFIGGGSMILPGVTIGDECIVGGGAVVFEDVPNRSMVVGNPARILRHDILVGRYGRLIATDEERHIELMPSLSGK